MFTAPPETPEASEALKTLDAAQAVETLETFECAQAAEGSEAVADGSGRQAFDPPRPGAAWPVVGRRYRARVETAPQADVAVVRLETGHRAYLDRSQWQWLGACTTLQGVAKVGQVHEVVVTKVNSTTTDSLHGGRLRIEVSRKLAWANPWERAHEVHPVGARVKGIVSNIVRRGMYVTLQGDPDAMERLRRAYPKQLKNVAGFRAFVSDSEMSWFDRDGDAFRVVGKERCITGPMWFSPGDEIELVVRQINAERSRIHASHRATRTNPWEQIEGRYPVGRPVLGRVMRAADEGQWLVRLPNGCVGVVPAGELGDSASLIGQRVVVTVESVEPQRRRLRLKKWAATEAVATSEGRAALGPIIIAPAGTLGRTLHRTAA